LKNEKFYRITASKLVSLLQTSQTPVDDKEESKESIFGFGRPEGPIVATHEQSSRGQEVSTLLLDLREK
jgi:hypothetical protein